jgi:membrane glycosyltransferase
MSTPEASEIPTFTYDLKKVADLLGTTAKALRARARRHEFDHIRVSDRNRRLTPVQLAKFLAQIEEEAQAAEDPLERDRQRVVRQRSGNTRRGAKAAA